ncbi:MFS transporter [Burkholderia sp. Bp8963]|uniref:MFS transporter n=1 Tax=Burkholderia sp. Bp8963 TaxID=2184547 RepID=UPI0021AB1882|nr:MFS transporter [Burkholderia sp. Bp8963]
MSAVPSTSHVSDASSLDARALFAAFAGLCGSLVAIGLARFAYTPLIPSMILAHWFSSSQTVTLGAANFAGYALVFLCGAGALALAFVTDFLVHARRTEQTGRQPAAR